MNFFIFFLLNLIFHFFNFIHFFLIYLESFEIIAFNFIYIFHPLKQFYFFILNLFNCFDLAKIHFIFYIFFYILAVFSTKLNFMMHLNLLDIISIFILKLMLKLKLWVINILIFLVNIFIINQN